MHLGWFNKIRARVSDEKGLTLMELIIAITMLSIVSMGAFMGFQFAFDTFSTSHEYIGDVYDSQLALENKLSYTFLHSINTTEADIETLFSLDTDEVDDDPILFEWGYFSGGTWNSTSPMEDFDVDGVTIILTSEGGQYLEKPINVYIPVDTEEH